MTTHYFLSSLSFQRKLESTPAWMQVVERRLEQAAEEGGPGEWVDGNFYRMTRSVVMPVTVIPALRECIA